MQTGQSDRHDQSCACQNTRNHVFVPVNDRDRTFISRLGGYQGNPLCRALILELIQSNQSVGITLYWRVWHGNGGKQNYLHFCMRAKVYTTKLYFLPLKSTYLTFQQPLLNSHKTPHTASNVLAVGVVMSC